MISAVGWVPRGAANPNPSRYEVSQKDLERIEQNESLRREHQIQKALSDVLDEPEEGKSLSPRRNTNKKNNKSSNNELDTNGLPMDLQMDDYDNESDNGSESQDEELMKDLVEGNAYIDCHDDDIVHLKERKDLKFVESGSDENDSDNDSQGNEMQTDADDDMIEENEEEDDDSFEQLVEESQLENVGKFSPFSQRATLEAGDLLDEIDNEDEEDDPDDLDDHIIRPSDAIILATNTEDHDHSVLEVHVYEEDTGNLYIHHDITLPAFPLAVEWLSSVGHKNEKNQGLLGSFAAIGSFEPQIEIWNLDVLDPLEPIAILGGISHMTQSNTFQNTNGGGKKGKKMNKKDKMRALRKSEPVYVEGSHTDAVLSLSWIQSFINVLASGSADSTVKIWDIEAGNCQHTSTHHMNKVNSVAWNPSEASILATGSHDGTVHVLDARSPDALSLSFKVASDVEHIAWNPFQSHELSASLESGHFLNLDIRKMSKSNAVDNKKAILYNIKAHPTTCSSFSYSTQAPGLLATCGLDQMVKLWDTYGKQGSGGEIVPLGEKNMVVGKLFSVSFYPSSPFLLTTGGDKGMLSVWNIAETEEKLVKRFENRMGTTSHNNSIVESMNSISTMDITANETQNVVSSTSSSKSKKNKKKGGK